MFTRLDDWDETIVLVRPEYTVPACDDHCAMQWGVEVVSPTKMFVVESYNGWHTWVRNTDIDSMDGAHSFIMAAIRQD